MQWLKLPSLRDKSRWISTVGRIAAVLALVYFGSALAQHWSQIADRGVTADEAFATIFLSIFYGFSLYLLAENWHRIVNALTTIRVERAISYPSYGLTQISKYLPGNFFHFVGRHVWLADRGVAHSALIGASTVEILSLAGSAILVIALSTVVMPSSALGVMERIIAPLAVFAFAVAAAGSVTMLLRSRIRWPPLTWGLIAFIVCLAGLFFILQGIIFFGLCRLVEPTVGMGVAGLATGAWLIGFLTPGAPGGIGSRELALMYFLQPVMTESNAIIAIALFRIVTTVGDLVCYLIALAVWNRSSR